MDELEKRYLEVVDCIPGYQVLPGTIEQLRNAIIRLDDDIDVINNFWTQCLGGHLEGVTSFEPGNRLNRTYSSIWTTAKTLTSLKTLYRFKLSELICSQPISDSAKIYNYDDVAASNEDALSNYVEF